MLALVVEGRDERIERPAREPPTPVMISGTTSARRLPWALSDAGPGGGCRTAAGTGGGFGCANCFVHCRAVESCCLRFRLYWVATEGTR